MYTTRDSGGALSCLCYYRNEAIWWLKAPNVTHCAQLLGNVLSKRNSGKPVRLKVN